MPRADQADKESGRQGALDQSCFLNGSTMSKTAVLKLVVCMASE